MGIVGNGMLGSILEFVTRVPVGSYTAIYVTLLSIYCKGYVCIAS